VASSWILFFSPHYVVFSTSLLHRPFWAQYCPEQPILTLPQPTFLARRERTCFTEQTKL